MAKSKPITVVGYLIMADSSIKRIEELTPEERAAWDRERIERTKRAMTDYYRRHPEQYALLPDAQEPENNGKFT